jgi:hypothetical protein
MGGVYRSILKPHYALSLDDETLSIINKPKHPPPQKKEGKTRNKMEGFRVWCLFLTRRANKMLLATKATAIYWPVAAQLNKKQKN